MGYMRNATSDKKSANFIAVRGFGQLGNEKVITLSVDGNDSEDFLKGEEYADGPDALFDQLIGFWLGRERADISWVPHDHMFSKLELEGLLNDSDETDSRRKAGKLPAKIKGYGWDPRI